MIVWTLDNTDGKEIFVLVKHFALMNEAKVDQIEDRLVAAYNECLDVRKLYEEELKMSYVKKKKIEELERENLEPRRKSGIPKRPTQECSGGKTCTWKCGRCEAHCGSRSPNRRYTHRGESASACGECGSRGSLI